MNTSLCVYIRESFKKNVFAVTCYLSSDWFFKQVMTTSQILLVIQNYDRSASNYKHEMAIFVQWEEDNLCCLFIFVKHNWNSNQNDCIDGESTQMSNQMSNSAMCPAFCAFNKPLLKYEFHNETHKFPADYRPRLSCAVCAANSFRQ